MARTIEQWKADLKKEAERAEFPIDREVYDKAKKDPLDPIPFAGSLDAPICVFARDLGKDEVAAGQPLIGAGGRLVRAGLFEKQFGSAPPKSDKTLESVLPFVLLTNTVPYKPPGNKAYAESVKERFRPFQAELLIRFWSGSKVLTLGNEAFDWFARYGEPGAAARFWAQEDRYGQDFPVVLTASLDGEEFRKSLTICPLPHPSPLNARWYPLFPGLLANRL